MTVTPPRPIRVLLFAPALSGVGGVERVVSHLDQMLSEQYQVYLCAFDKPSATLHYDNRLTFYPLGEVVRLPLFFRPVTYIIKAWRLKKLKAVLQIDVTISNLWGADLISILSGGKDKKIAIGHINVVGNPTNALMLKLLGLVAWIYRRFDRVISVSEPLNQELRSLYRLRPHKTLCIHNTIPNTDTHRLSIVRQGKRLIWCGRMVPEKNPEGVLAVFRKVRESAPEVQLLMLGDGPLTPKVRQLCERFGLSVGNTVDDGASAVLLPGFVRDPVECMRQARLQLMTSHAEGLPMVLLEGLSVGLPAIASDCPSGGVRDAMGGVLLGQLAALRQLRQEATVCGLLLPIPEPDDEPVIDLWVNEIVHLLADDESLAQLSRGAVERARFFSRETIKNRWFSTIDALVQE